MNKLLRLLLALLLVTVLALGIVACGEEDTAPVTDDTDQTDTTNEPEHTHKWVAATCKAPKTCKTCGETEGKALAHTPATAVEENRVEATCGEAGSYDNVVYCSVCKAEISRKTETILATGEHDWADATTEAPKTCKVCGATEGDPLPPEHEHNYDDVDYVYDAEGHWKECACGKEDGKTAKEAHDWADATTEAPKTCKVCGATEGEPLPPEHEHNYDDVEYSYDADGHWKECACGKEDGKTAKEAHDWADATTEAPKTCKVCGATEGEPLPPEHEHNYDDVDYVYDAEGHWKECACGKEDGKTEKEAHSFGEWEQTKAPEVGVAGEKTRSCACGYVETEAIDPLPNPEPPSGEPTWEEYNVNLNTQGIKILGERNATKASDGRIWLDWAGSGIEMNVRLDFTYTVRIFLQAMAEEGTCTFAIYVDGELFGDGYYTISCGLEEQFIDVANVPAGDHVIRIVKVTDYTTTSAEILMIYMDGEFLETPADNDLYIEFIGDAITTGYDDVTKSYAWIVAEAFNADYAITALNGYGLVNGSAEVGTGSMAQDYLKLNPLRDATTPFRYENREADVIVINLGAEDYYYDELFNGELFPDAFQAAYEALIADARYYNPNAKILCVYGAANDGYADAILAAVEAAGGEEAGIWTLALDLTAEEAEDGINLPSAEEQAAYAEVIGAKIAEIKDVTFGAADEPVVGEGESQDWNNA